jgi:hypothetical protein
MDRIERLRADLAMRGYSIAHRGPARALPGIDTTPEYMMIYSHEQRPIRGNRAFLAAYRKGHAARMAGEPFSANPYPDGRNDRGGVTFSRAFGRYWERGWLVADREADR